MVKQDKVALAMIFSFEGKKIAVSMGLKTECSCKSVSNRLTVILVPRPCFEAARKGDRCEIEHNEYREAAVGVAY